MNISPDRFPASGPPRTGIVRGLPNTYEVDAFGGTYSSNPMARWHRGDVERSAQPAVQLGPEVFMYDPTVVGRVNAGFGGAN